jgi:pimeloyl-ACP methyl ester carboxylesterase
VPDIEVPGIRIHYETAGERGPTLVLVHGSGGSAAVWAHQLDGLAGVARVVAIDLPGHGRSAGEAPATIAASVAVVRGLVEALDLPTVVLGGHSMGGAVAQAFALAHADRLAGLVLIGTGARLRVLPEIIDTLERDHPAGVRLVADLAVGAGAPAGVKTSVHETTLAAPPRSLIADFRACDAFDVIADLGTIAVPTLVVCGAEDRLTPPKYADFLRQRIPGARLVVVPGAGHYVQLERPAETTAALRDFLLEVRP